MKDIDNVYINKYSLKRGIEGLPKDVEWVVILF